MKTKKLISVTIVVIAVAMFAGIGPASAEGNVIYVEGTAESAADPATCTAVGGTYEDYGTPESGDDACLLVGEVYTLAPDGKHVRGTRTGYWRDESPDPRFTGYDTVSSNLYLNLDTGTARMWGTWNLVPDDLAGHGWREGTAWQGTWEAHGLPNGKFFMVGHAKGTGSFEGLNVVIRRELATMMVISTGGGG
jgi:hypothetical protein